MVVDKRKIEKDVWQTTAPFLNLPPTNINGEQNNEGMRRYMAARRAIQEAVKDPMFVQRFQQGKVTMLEALTHSFPQDIFDKLFETDMRALVPMEKKKK
jgi:hypothetical protein